MKFKFSYWQVLIAAAVMVVLVILIYMVRISDPEQKDWLFDKTRQLTIADAELNKELWRRQIGVTENNADVQKNLTLLSSLKKDLFEGDYAVKLLNDDQLNSLLDALDGKVTTKTQQVNTVLDEIRILFRQIDTARRGIESLQKDGNNAAILKDLNQELYYALYTPLNANNSKLQNLSNAIMAHLTSFPSSQQYFIEQIIVAVNKIIETNKTHFVLLESLSQSSQNHLTQDFEEALQRFFQQRQHHIYILQNILCVIALISILWATYLLVKLSAKEKDLSIAYSNIENLQYAFDQHAIISFSDAAGNFTRVNEKFCTLSEYSENELIGKNHWMMHANENQEAIYIDMVEKTGNGNVWHGELQSKTNTGKSYWVYATIVPFMNSNNQIYQLISIRTDITLSKRLEQQITESKNFIQKLTDTMTQGVYAIDQDGLCSFWNKQAEYLLGWSKREVIMREIEKLIVYHDNDGQMITMDEHFLTDQTKTIEARVRSKNGVTFPVSVTTAPLHENNKIIGFVVVFQDISELKEQQRLLNEAMQAAESANHTKSAFLANMSHEIRTPMNGIIGMTDLALDTELTPEQREFLNISKNSANALLTIINDILDFSKIEAGKLELDAFEFDLHQVMRETIKNLSIRAYQKGLEMILDTAEDVPRYLVGDSGRLGQIIINLIGNAIKFTEKGEVILRIRLTTQKDQQVCLQFAVEDTGIGIPQDRQKEVFSSFSQVDASVFRKYGGTGLGLSIAKQLVELMNGKIGVTSQLNKGTCFYFTAWFKTPLKEVPRVQPLKMLDTMRALVVDDNTRMRNIMAESLASWGMQVQALASGQDVLNQLKKEQNEGKSLQLLIIDEELSDIDGFSLAEQLQDDHLSDAPIILLLSSIYSVGRVRKQGAKIACVISKPASQSDILDAVHTVFNGPVAQPLALTDAVHTQRMLKPLDILLAEDNAINQQLAVRLLEKQGHKVTVANNGEECLLKLAEHTYDLVLMDFQMPVMDGLEATRRLRKLGFSLPVIAMTANAMKGDRERAIDAGMTDYLTKPIKVSELFEVLGRYFPEVDEMDTSPRLPLSQSAPEADKFELSLEEPKLTLELELDTRPKDEEREQSIEKPISDWKSALALLGDDEEILVNMAEMFIANADNYILEIQSALEQKQVAELARALHTLKGVFGLFKATQAEELLISAEVAAQEGRIADVAKVFPDIRLFVKRLTAFLSEKLKVLG